MCLILVNKSNWDLPFNEWGNNIFRIYHLVVSQSAIALPKTPAVSKSKSNVSCWTALS